MSENIDYEKILEHLEKELHKDEIKWNKIVDTLAKKITNEIKESIDLSAEAISYRQMLLEERTQCYYKIYRSMPKLKQLRKSKFEYYSTRYQIKTNSTEKVKLIDADLAYHEAKLEFIQNHNNFISESIKNVDHVIYSVKNKIEMHNITGLD